MPAVNRQQIKHTAVPTPAGSNTPTASVRVSPETPRRTFLYIVNTGANPGLLRLGDKVQGDGADIPIAAGADFGPLQIAETCPSEAINLGSVAATTWAVIEGVTNG